VELNKVTRIYVIFPGEVVLLYQNNPSFKEANMRFQLLCFVALALAPVALMAKDANPENLALKATATATSEYSQAYLAKFAVDDNVPQALSQQDLDMSWAAKGNNHPHGHRRQAKDLEELTLNMISSNFSAKFTRFRLSYVQYRTNASRLFVVHIC